MGEAARAEGPKGARQAERERATHNDLAGSKAKRKERRCGNKGDKGSENGFLSPLNA